MWATPLPPYPRAWDGQTLLPRPLRATDSETRTSPRIAVEGGMKSSSTRWAPRMRSSALGSPMSIRSSWPTPTHPRDRRGEDQDGQDRRHGARASPRLLVSPRGGDARRARAATPAASRLPRPASAASGAADDATRVRVARQSSGPYRRAVPLPVTAGAHFVRRTRRAPVKDLQGRDPHAPRCACNTGISAHRAPPNALRHVIVRAISAPRRDRPSGWARGPLLAS